MTTYAYYRVSTREQDYNSQKIGVLKFCEDKKIHIDAEVVDQAKSGALSPDKRNIGTLLNNLQKGDVIVCAEISRLGRSLMIIMQILKEIMDKECKLYCVKENYELGDNIVSKVLAFAFGLSAEIERNLVIQRTKEGQERARLAGKKIGRQKGVTYYKLSKLDSYIRELITEGYSISEIARKVNCKWTTVHRYLKEHNIEYDQSKYKNENLKRKLNLTELYCACKKYKSMEEVRKQFQTSRHVIRRHLDMLGITPVPYKGFKFNDFNYGDTQANHYGALSVHNT